jgi:hypothetical protein
MNNLLRAPLTFVVSLAAVGVMGCGHHGAKGMTVVPTANTTAATSEAVVVFVRPSNFGGAIQSEVFEVPEGQPAQLIGILGAKKKLVYRTTPGRHMFMIVGESADFMDSQLEGGKLYYAEGIVRMGVWKARFSLKPLHPADKADLDKWLAASEWVEMNADSATWMQANAADIEAKRTAYFVKWTAKPDAERPALLPADGQ